MQSEMENWVTTYVAQVSIYYTTRVMSSGTKWHQCNSRLGGIFNKQHLIVKKLDTCKTHDSEDFQIEEIKWTLKFFTRCTQGFHYVQVSLFTTWVQTGYAGTIIYYISYTVSSEGGPCTTQYTMTSGLQLFKHIFVFHIGNKKQFLVCNIHNISPCANYTLTITYRHTHHGYHVYNH